ncbi:MAG TPA: hypothetical protein VMW47_01895 [Verrucomicrobiae bacterium]|nr:hypothetical protein [Verrucomicrobiae bacterium]
MSRWGLAAPPPRARGLTPSPPRPRLGAGCRRRGRSLRRYRRGLVRGLGLGLLLGVLYAPRPGRESRALVLLAVRWGRRVRRTLRWLRAA